MKAPQVVFAVLCCLSFGGCATSTPEAKRPSEYVPHSERPLSAKEYWDRRSRQDEVERNIEERSRRQ